MDVTDVKILNILRTNAKISNVDLSREIGMAPSATLERVRKLEHQGILRGYEARIDERKLGYKLQVLVYLLTQEKLGDMGVGVKLAAFPEITEVYELSGKYSYLLKISVQDTDALHRLICRIGDIPGVVSSETTLVLSTIKDTCSVELPLEP